MQKLFLCFISFLLATTMALAQSRVVHGTVLDTGGVPLIGVTVMVQGTSAGTITDFDGNFNLSVPSESSVLLFSYIGYKTIELPVGNAKQLKVEMESEATAIDEVVVVGYGSQKKVSVTGAVAAITADDIMKTPTSNVQGALAGRLPGLTITQSSGQPGAEAFTMRLRGISTVNGQNPLILVDGVPREESMNLMDPSEIESISILKDASATAVFGVRGANGVVLITTKTGTSEKPALSITAEYGLQDYTRDYSQVDSWEYATMYNLARANDGLPAQFSPREIELYRNGSNPQYYPNVDWYDLMFRDFAPMTRFNVNYSGKTDRVSYFANVGYVNQQSMYDTATKKEVGYNPAFNLNRYNFRTNLDIKLNSWIKTSVKMSGYVSSVNQPYDAYKSDVHYFAMLFQQNSATPAMWEKGTIGPDGEPLPDDLYFTPMANGVNPYAAMNLVGYHNETRVNINSQLAVDFDLSFITKGLKAKAMYAFDTNGSTVRRGYNGNDGGANSTTYLATQWLIGEDENGNTQPEFQVPEMFYSNFVIRRGSSFRYKQNVQASINYDRIFNDVHKVTAMVLGQYDDSEALSGNSIKLLPYRRLGISGRATYNYADRYLAEVNMGYNGSEQFAKGKRFGFFPAASLGWVVSNEGFLLDNPVVSNLKVRASYGKVGSDALGGDRFLYLDEILTATGGADQGVFVPTLGDASILIQTLIGNPNLTWETALKGNYGIDLGFFNNALTLTADYFREDRSNILITPTTTPTVGGTPSTIVPAQNAGEVFNHGTEVSARYSDRFGDWMLGLGLNFTYAKNTRIEMAELALGEQYDPNKVYAEGEDHGYMYPYRAEGHAIGQNWGLMVDWNSPGNGYFVSQDELDQYTYIGTPPRLGDFVYVDQNGDGIIDVKDEVPIGYGSVPNITYSFDLSVGYKGFDLSAMFYGVDQVTRFFNGNGVYENSSPVGSPMEHHKQSWTMQRYATGQEITYPALCTTASSSQRANDFFIQSTSYLRLKNLEIGYTLPAKLTKKAGINRCRFYLNGQNLITFDNLRFKDFDPENNKNAVIPIPRTVNLGLQLSL